MLQTDVMGSLQETVGEILWLSRLGQKRNHSALLGLQNLSLPPEDSWLLHFCS